MTSLTLVGSANIPGLPARCGMLFRTPEWSAGNQSKTAFDVDTLLMNAEGRVLQVSSEASL